MIKPKRPNTNPRWAEYLSPDAAGAVTGGKELNTPAPQPGPTGAAQQSLLGQPQSPVMPNLRRMLLGGM